MCHSLNIYYLIFTELCYQLIYNLYIPSLHVLHVTQHKYMTLTLSATLLCALHSISFFLFLTSASMDGGTTALDGEAQGHIGEGETGPAASSFLALGTGVRLR